LLLYYITDRTQFPGEEDARRDALLHNIAEAAACGVDYIQLREKDLPGRQLESLANAAVRLIHENARSKQPTTRLLINSRVDIAIACAADGVHLRSQDISPRDVGRIWSARRSDQPTIAVSCHSVKDVARAASEEADLAVFAPVFEKIGMPETHATGLSALREACRQKIPVLALGGVNLENARSCIEAGAAGIAGIRLFQAGNLADVVRLLRSETTETKEDHGGKRRE
jgi:thiamine-phosphate pyrophosphorylase